MDHKIHLFHSSNFQVTIHSYYIFTHILKYTLFWKKVAIAVLSGPNVKKKTKKNQNPKKPKKHKPQKTKQTNNQNPKLIE